MLDQAIRYSLLLERLMKTTHVLHSPEQTEIFARKIGSRLRGGECIELSSDLGGGKTTFTRGIAMGAGSTDMVNSPTFTIGKQYSAGELTIYHFDFYRLQEAGLVAEELLEALEEPKAIIVIEWAQTVADVLPANKIHIEIRKSADNNQQRSFVMDVPAEFSYILDQEAI